MPKEPSQTELVTTPKSGNILTQDAAGQHVYRQPTVDDAGSSMALLALIERAARDPACDVAKAERYLDMAIKMRAIESEQAFHEAMSNAQSEMPVVVKMGKNPHTNSTYAKFEHVNEIAKPIYTKHGLSLIFSEGDAPTGVNKIRILGQVAHRRGHSRTHHIDLSPDDTGAKGSQSKTKIHGEGSTLTYGRRYLTCLIFNISLVNEDDDGCQGQRPKPPGPSKLQPQEPSLKDLAAELWTVLKPVRGEAKSWVQANQWLWKVEILDGATDEAAPNLTAERFREVIAKAKAQLV